MNILYTIDNNFIPQLAAGIVSICDNNKKADRISFYIFSYGISSENQLSIRQLATSYHREIFFIDISNFMDSFDFDFDTNGWNEIVLSRLLMARFLPDSLHRVLYLDGDTIVRDDLDTLWTQNLGGCPIGAVMEPTANRKRRNEMGIGSFPYYNAGVLLVDLDKWRSTHLEQQLLECCKNRASSLFANDQDAINVTLAGRIYPLSIAYNYSNSFYYYPFVFLNRLMPQFDNQVDFNNSFQNPIIIHYLGEDRPWRNGNTHKYSDDYRFYLSKTNWADTPMEKGWETYFAFWRLFNNLVNKAPRLRYAIIDGLIPLFMRFRKLMRKR